MMHLNSLFIEIPSRVNGSRKVQITDIEIGEEIMLKWEYLIITDLFVAPPGGNIASDLPGTYVVRTVNDKDMSTQKILISEYINQIGDEGWELFHIHNNNRWIFKRSKPDQNS
jgi:hypothetical protein